MTMPESAGLLSWWNFLPEVAAARTNKGPSMKITFQKFFRREDCAITVDWVVPSAAVIGMGMLVLVPITFSTESSTQGVADYIADFPVGYDGN